MLHRAHTLLYFPKWQLSTTSCGRMADMHLTSFPALIKLTTINIYFNYSALCVIPSRARNLEACTHAAAPKISPVGRNDSTIKHLAKPLDSGYLSFNIKYDSVRTNV